MPSASDDPVVAHALYAAAQHTHARMHCVRPRWSLVRTHLSHQVYTCAATPYLLRVTSTVWGALTLLLGLV